MKQLIVGGVVLIFGLAGAGYYLSNPGSQQGMSGAANATPAAAEPLYWVAPMDPNFRRDQPGKSPMGMDLVPVYAAQDDGKGVVRISPTVEHNIGVRTAVARLGQLEDALTTVAYVQFNEKGIWHAYPRVDGWIDRLYVDTEGEEVKKDEPLYDIYSPTLVNAQEEYVSALRSNNPALINSSAERMRTLEVPDQLVRALKQNGKVQQTVTVRAPQDGVISKLTVREGHYVTPGTEILELAALDNVWLTAEVLGRDADRVEIGNEMEVRFANRPGQIYRASIDFVSPVLNAVSRTLEVRASLPNQGKLLRPNMFAEARLGFTAGEDQVLVPRDALIRTGLQDRVVMKVSDGAYKSVAVQSGRFGSNDVEILDGLTAGDIVVSSAHFLIDSESSISSDFRRMDLAQVDHSTMDHGAMDHGTMDHSTMDHSTMDHSAMDHGDMSHGGSHDSTEEAQSPGVWVMGSIRSVDADAGTVILRHEPIPAWNWPAMTMTMDMGKDINPDSLKPGESYRLHLVEQPEASTGYQVLHAVPAETPE